MRTRAVARMRRGTRRLASVPWLTAVWLLLWGRLTWTLVVGGLLVSLLLVSALPLPPVARLGRVRPLAAAWFLLRFLGDLVLASLQVAWQALEPPSRRRARRSAVVAVPLHTDSDLLLTMTAQTLTLVPGSIVVDVDRERSVLYAHVLSVRSQQDVERFRAEVLDLESRVVSAFGQPRRQRRRRPHHRPTTPARKEP